MNSQTQTVRTIDRQLQALELRKAGVSYRHIAEQLGYRGVSGAHSAVARALQKVIQEPATEVLSLELERWMRCCWLYGLTPSVATTERLIVC